MTLSSWFTGIVGSAPAPRWVAVLDTSVLVPAAIAARNDTINVKVVRAAIAGLYECVLSEYIKEETRETMQEDLGLEIGEIEARFAPLWAKARVLRPVPFEDPQLLMLAGAEDVPPCRIRLFRPRR